MRQKKAARLRSRKEVNRGVSMAKTIKANVGKETIAQLFGLTSRRIEQLVKDGVIESKKMKNGQVRFELEATIQAYIAYLSDKAHGREKNAAETDLSVAKLRAEVALKESQSELHQLRTSIVQGNYIPVEEVKADYNKFFIVFKNFALAIPGKVAGRLSGLASPVEIREIENDLQKEVKNVLNGFVSRAVVAPVQQEDVTKPKKRGRPRKNASK